MQTECAPSEISDADLKQWFTRIDSRTKKQPPREPPPPINPFVVVRYNATDIGSRPAPSSAIAYLSPDILVTSLSGSPDILADRPHLLQARLSNFGLFPASSVHVDFYWANPSMAITETSVNFIGSGVLSYLPAGSAAGSSSLLVDCASQWVPRYENGGHECLLVRATVPTFDAGPVPLDPWLSYRVGQRNLTVLQVAPGQPFQMQIRVANFAPFPLPALVFGGRMEPRLWRAILSPGAREKSRRTRPLEEGSLNWRITADDPPEQLTGPSRLFAQRLLAEGEQSVRPANVRPLWEHNLPACTEQRLTVRAVIPQAARSGTVFTLSLGEQLGPIVTGGYGLVLVVDER